MIEIRNLYVHYGSISALQDVSLDVAAGECVLVTGPSGCGKSTLARLLSGLIPQVIPARVEGSVRVDGVNILKQSTPEVAQKVGSVFQNPASQLFHLKVEDEIAFGPQNLGLPQELVKERVEWAIEAVGLQDLRRQRPSDLSGGQKQLVAIGAALAMQPQVLVLDEPTASLDVPGTQRVVATIQSLLDRCGVTVLLIEHRLAEVYQLADRAIILDEGRIVVDGPTRQVLSDRERLKKLGLRRPVEEQLSPWEQLIQPNGAHTGGNRPLIELQKVTAGYNRHPIIQDINLAIYPGEFIALVGNNGAGKTTLALTAAGLLRPYQGKVIFQGGRKPRPGLDISLLFQSPTDQLFTDRVEDEIAFGPQNYGLFDPTLHQQVLAETDLVSLKDRRPLALSCGQQQRTTLGACLSLQPQLLILDEPTLGQDWGHLQRLMDFLVTLNRRGVAVLLITHDFKLVHRYAHRVVLMEAGRITLDGKLVQEQEAAPEI
jgi:energy-coupling factor transport system ATP-binding protein